MLSNIWPGTSSFGRKTLKKIINSYYFPFLNWRNFLIPDIISKNPVLFMSYRIERKTKETSRLCIQCLPFFCKFV